MGGSGSSPLSRFRARACVCVCLTDLPCVRREGAGWVSPAFNPSIYLSISVKERGWKRKRRPAVLACLPRALSSLKPPARDRVRHLVAAAAGDCGGGVTAADLSAGLFEN